MQPDAQQTRPAEQAGLPPVSPAPQPVATPGAPAPAASSIPTPSTSMTSAANQAKRLVAQYRQDPYRLNQAIGELKANVQAAQYNVTPKATGN